MLVGFKCPNSGGNVLFANCYEYCANRCEPLPLLLALASEGRVTPNVFHVTEIHNPPQLVYLKRHTDYYGAPHSFTWMMFGIALHSVIENQKNKLKELGLDDQYLIERRIEHIFDIDGQAVTMSGQMDLFDKTDGTLYDFKTMKFYYDILNICVEGKPVKDEYTRQLNVYNVYGNLGAEHLKIKALVKDYNKKIERQYNIPPIVTIDVPMLPDDEVRLYTESLIREHVNADSSGLVRPCTPGERWYSSKTKSYNRCADYCPVSDVCPQLQQENHEKVQRKAAL